MTRTCYVCGEVKDLSQFYKDRNRFRYDCKECNKKASKEANKDRGPVLRRKYYDSWKAKQGSSPAILCQKEGDKV
jgi:hypothetical protein